MRFAKSKDDKTTIILNAFHQIFITFPGVKEGIKLNIEKVGIQKLDSVRYTWDIVWSRVYDVLICEYHM